MNAQRIHELLAGYLSAPLSDEQTEQLRAYLELLLKWNAKTNLTAIREPEQIVQRHFGESLALAETVMQRAEVREAIDVGSGAGFPGLPFALYAPPVRVTLIESQNKKATFLKEVVRALDLKNVSVINQRAEEVRITADVITLRAVERFTQALMTGATLVRPGGRIALLVRAEQVKEVKLVLGHRNPRWHERPLPNNARVLIAEV